MYLSNDQRYNLAVKMLSIVEHMVFGKGQPTAVTPQVISKPAEDDGHDDALNAIIREQLKTSDSSLMAEEQNG